MGSCLAKQWEVNISSTSRERALCEPNASQTAAETRHFIKKVLSHRVASSTAVASKSLCIGAPLALDFEWQHVLAWIAYHTLIGVDCFVLLLDLRVANMSHPPTLATYNQLRRVPTLAEIIDMPHEAAPHVEAIAAELPHVMQRTLGARAPRYHAYVDADEMLVVEPQRGPGHAAKQGLPSTAVEGRRRSGLPQVPEVLDDLQLEERGACGVYVERWSYGFRNATFQGDSASARFAHMLDRSPGCQYPQKMIVRVASGVRLLNMHAIRQGAACQMLLPDGSQSSPPDYTTRRQQLSLNHYADDSLRGCMQKYHHSHIRSSGLRSDSKIQFDASLGRFILSKGAPRCEETWEKMLAFNASVVHDPVLTGYVERTNARARELFFRSGT